MTSMREREREILKSPSYKISLYPTTSFFLFGTGLDLVGEGRQMLREGHRR